MTMSFRSILKPMTRSDGSNESQMKTKQARDKQNILTLVL